jgi:membrane protein
MTSIKARPQTIDFLRAIYHAWVSERPGQQAAALAYFGLFSIAPMIFVAFTIASLFLEQMVDYSRFYERLAIALGPEAAETIQNAVYALGDKTFGGSTLVTVISILALLFAASGMFFQIQFALNTIFKAPQSGNNQTKTFILQRLFSFLMVLGVGLLVIVASILNVAISWFGSILGDITGVGQALAVLDWLTLFGLVVFAFALLYKILPDVRLAWRDVWLGAALAAVLAILAGIILGIYFRVGGVGSAFEAAGTFAVILIAINVFGQIFLFGALFTREYALWYGSGKHLADESDG